MLGGQIRRIPDALGVALAVFALVVPFGASVWVLLALFTVVLVIGVVGLDGVRTVRAVAYSFVLSSVFILVLSRVQPGFQLGQLSIWFLFGATLCIGYAVPGPQETDVFSSRHLAFPSLILVLTFWGFRTLSASQSLARMAGDYAEDNGAWLIALAKSSEGRGTLLRAASTSSGGPSTGWSLTLVRTLEQLLGESPVRSVAENAMVLIRSYMFWGVLTGLVLCIAAGTLANSMTPLWRFVAPIVATGVHIPFMVSLMKVGHFSATIAVLGLATALAVATSRRTGMRSDPWTVSGIAIALVAAGQAWYPSTGIALLFVVLTMGGAGLLWLRSTNRDSWSPRRIASASAVIVTLVVIASRLFPNYLANIRDIDYLLGNLRLVGGYAPVNPLLFFAAVLLSFVFVTKKWRESRWISPFLVSVVAPLLLLLLISYAMTPNTPQYGVLKYMFIVASVLTPLAAAAVSEFIGSLLTPRSAPLVGVAVFSAVMMYSPPGSELKWLSKYGDRSNEWAPAVVSGVKLGRTVVCLNTVKGDTGRDYEAYLCTRMAASLAGIDTYEVRTWTAANICQIPIEQATAAFRGEFQENLRVLVFDPSRLSSGAGCQAVSAPGSKTWTSPIDWSRVEVVGPDGRRVDTARFADKEEE